MPAGWARSATSCTRSTQALSGREADFRDLLHPTRRIHRHARSTAPEPRRHHRRAEPGRLDLRRPARRRSTKRCNGFRAPSKCWTGSGRNLTTALTKLGKFSDTANRLVNDTQADLVKNLKNLQPTHPGARRRRTGPRRGHRLRDGVPLRPEPHRPGGPRRLHQPLRDDRHLRAAPAQVDLPRAHAPARRDATWCRCPASRTSSATPTIRWVARSHRHRRVARFRAARESAERPDLNADPPGADRRSLPGPGSYPAQAPPPMPPVTGPVLPVVPQAERRRWRRSTVRRRRRGRSDLRRAVRPEVRSPAAPTAGGD